MKPLCAGEMWHLHGESGRHHMLIDTHMHTHNHMPGCVPCHAYRLILVQCDGKHTYTSNELNPEAREVCHNILDSYIVTFILNY